MTRKHFVAANAVASVCQQFNPAFDIAKFLTACGVQ